MVPVVQVYLHDSNCRHAALQHNCHKIMGLYKYCNLQLFRPFNPFLLCCSPPLLPPALPHLGFLVPIATPSYLSIRVYIHSQSPGYPLCSPAKILAIMCLLGVGRGEERCVLCCDSRFGHLSGTKIVMTTFRTPYRIGVKPAHRLTAMIGSLRQVTVDFS